jgi:MFS family permease
MRLRVPIGVRGRLIAARGACAGADWFSEHCRDSECLFRSRLGASGSVTVLGSALVAPLVPNERRGGALGVYGDVIGVPSVLALPLGVWLVGTSGIEPRKSPERWPRFAGTAVVAALIGRAPKPEEMIGVVSDLRTPALARLSLKFAVAAMGAGVVVTFMPVAERFVSTLRPDVSTESSSSGV